MTENQNKIYHSLTGAGACSLKLSYRTGIPYKEVESDLKKLVKKGVVRMKPNNTFLKVTDTWKMRAK